MDRKRPLRRKVEPSSTGLVFLSREESPNWLVDQLNDSEDKAEAVRLGQLVRDLNELARLRKDERHFTPQGRMVGSVAIALWRRVNAELDGVSWRPHVLPGDRRNGFDLRWGPVNSPPEYDFQIWSGIAFNLAAGGLLTKVRQCEYCQKWYAAGKHGDTQRFCETNCRKYSYGKTEKGRERNAKYQREFRAREKRKDQQARLAVARKLR